MKRRAFCEGGTAAVAATLIGYGGGALSAADQASGVESATTEGRRTNRTGPVPAQATPVPPAPRGLPVAVRAMTFQMEFTDPGQPLLQRDGGPFNPYFVYFGGDGRVQPEGEPGFRWWNDELQVFTTDRYTPAPYNPNSVADGILSMTAIRAAPGYPNSPKPYLGSCLETSNGPHWHDAKVRAARFGFEQKYGYWECRARVPKGQGLWSAFWLNGGIIAGQPGHGELDIFEMVSTSGRVHQTAHDWFGPHVQEVTAVKPAFDHSAGYHTYGLHWTPTGIVWYIDGVATGHASAALVAKYRALCGPMFLSMNLAVGGGWAGAPDATTVFPAVLNFDYVRAYSIA